VWTLNEHSTSIARDRHQATLFVVLDDGIVSGVSVKDVVG
jgi:hypothetical protein